MASAMYNYGKFKIWDGTIDLAAGTIMGVLVQPGTYVFNADHRFLDPGVGGATSVEDNEVTGSGYSRQTLASKVIAVDDTNDKAQFTSDPLAFGTIVAGQQAMACVIFFSTGTDTTSILISYNDSVDFPLTFAGTPVLVAPPAVGWFRY